MYHHNTADPRARQGHYRPSGRRAAEIAADVEAAVAAGRAGPGTVLPPVRALAAELGLATGTVAAAYRLLSDRGIVEGRTRSGTVVRARPGAASRRLDAVAPGMCDLATGNPDPALLADLDRVLGVVASRPRPVGLYGGPAVNPDLAERARRLFADDGISLPSVTVMGGALDAIERALEVHVRPGMRVAVEDPGYAGALDLIAAMGLVPEPVALDDEGMDPDSLAAALRRGAQAVILTPRAQNPTGAALTEDRARALRPLLHGVMVIEDDHAGAVAGAPAVTVTGGHAGPAVVVRSCSKVLGPDLRVALVVGDAATVEAMEARRSVGAGWVSHVLQELVVEALNDVTTSWAGAAARYRERRDALVGALAAAGVAARGRSGLNVWVPVPEEGQVVAGMAARGWAVAPGARYRIASPPAVRVTVSTLGPQTAERVANDLAATLAGADGTRAS